MKRKDALWQFEEHTATFGVVDYFKAKIWPDSMTGILSRYAGYCAWSKWDNALFLPHVPEIGKFSAIKGASWSPDAEKADVLNFDPSSMTCQQVCALCLAIGWCVVFQTRVQHLPNHLPKQARFQLPFVFLDSVLEWLLFVYLVVVFPAGLAVFFLSVD